MTTPVKKTKGGEKPTFNKQHYKDGSGIPRVVLVPEGEADVEAGIPVSLDLSPLYPHMPDTFLKDLYEALHAQGLIEAADYFKVGASDRFRAAMLTVIRHDFLNAQAIAKEELK